MSCPVCGSYGLCAVDCSLAPWNQDKAKPSKFGYLLRQRRWAQSPVDLSSIFWVQARP